MYNAKPHGQRGFSLGELLVVVAMIGLTVGASAAAWNSYRRATNANSAASTVRMGVSQARLLAIYRNVNHFVVIDPAQRTVTIFEDSSAPFGGFNNGDTQVSQQRWSAGVTLDLPTAPSPLSRPMGSGNITNAWDLPTPDSGLAWGANLRGVMLTPQGRVMSGESPPVMVGLGTIVLNDGNFDPEKTVSVAVEGISGAVRSFRHDGSDWQEM